MYDCIHLNYYNWVSNLKLIVRLVWTSWIIHTDNVCSNRNPDNRGTIDLTICRFRMIRFTTASRQALSNRLFLSLFNVHLAVDKTTFTPLCAISSANWPSHSLSLTGFPSIKFKSNSEPYKITTSIKKRLQL